MEAGVRMAANWLLVDDSRYSKGLFNIYDTAPYTEYTPTFYVFKLIANYFAGDHLVSITVGKNVPPLWAPSISFQVPYTSTWASVSDDGKFVYVLFINRHEVCVAIHSSIHSVTRLSTLR